MKVPTTIGEQMHAIRCELAGLTTELIRDDYIELAQAGLVAIDSIQSLEAKLEDFGMLAGNIAAAIELPR